MLTCLDQLLDRVAAGLGATGPLTAEDQPRWAAAGSLADLGELTAQWLEGRVLSQPGYYGPVDVDEDDAPGLAAILAALNRIGYVTFSSQAGCDSPGFDGAGWRQRAAVTGLASPEVCAWLRGVLAGTRFGMRAWPCKTRWWRRSGQGVPVTWWAGRRHTTFGTQLSTSVITGEIYPGAGETALDAACAALQVTVFDPRCGPNDLWPVLRRAAAHPPRTDGATLRRCARTRTARAERGAKPLSEFLRSRTDVRTPGGCRTVARLARTVVVASALAATLLIVTGWLAPGVVAAIFSVWTALNAALLTRRARRLAARDVRDAVAA